MEMVVSQLIHKYEMRHVDRGLERSARGPPRKTKSFHLAPPSLEIVAPFASIQQTVCFHSRFQSADLTNAYFQRSRATLTITKKFISGIRSKDAFLTLRKIFRRPWKF